MPSFTGLEPNGTVPDRSLRSPGSSRPIAPPPRPPHPQPQPQPQPQPIATKPASPKNPPVHTKPGHVAHLGNAKGDRLTTNRPEADRPDSAHGDSGPADPGHHEASQAVTHRSHPKRPPAAPPAVADVRLNTWSVKPPLDPTAAVVGDIGRTVLAAGEAIENLARQTANLACQLERTAIQSDRNASQLGTTVEQVREQGYQIFALCDAVQTLAEQHHQSLAAIERLQGSLDRLSDRLSAF